MVELRGLFNASIILALHANARGDTDTANEAIEIASQASTIITESRKRTDGFKKALLLNARGDSEEALRTLQETVDSPKL